jgi:hypothetical protein
LVRELRPDENTKGGETGSHHPIRVWVVNLDWSLVVAKFVSQNRYRLVNLQSGKVVVVFQITPGVSPYESGRQACHELGIELDVGSYRLDSLKQNRTTRDFKWSKVYRFSLETG